MSGGEPPTSERTDDAEGRQPDRSGVLSRDLLKQLSSAGLLRNLEGTSLLIGQDTVKLHLGHVAWLQDGSLQKKINVEPNHPLRLTPGCVATLITQEEVSVPLSLTGVIYPRGRLLPLGLLSTTVHVDPGFCGRLRVIVANVGQQVIDVPYGYEIARLQLARLTQELSTPYIGVNAELDQINPHAGDLIAPIAWKSSVELSLAKLAEQQRDIDVFRAVVTTRELRRKKAILVSAALCTIAVLILTAILIGRWVSATSARDLTLQVIAGIVSGAATILVASAHTKVRGGISLWLANTGLGKGPAANPDVPVHGDS